MPPLSLWPSSWRQFSSLPGTPWFGWSDSSEESWKGSGAKGLPSRKFLYQLLQSEFTRRHAGLSWRGCYCPKLNSKTRVDGARFRAMNAIGTWAVASGAGNGRGRGKSGHHRMLRPGKPGAVPGKPGTDGPCHRKKTARRRLVRRKVRVKRWGKSPPLRRATGGRTNPGGCKAEQGRRVIRSSRVSGTSPGWSRTASLRKESSGVRLPASQRNGCQAAGEIRRGPESGLWVPRNGGRAGNAARPSPFRRPAGRQPQRGRPRRGTGYQSRRFF